MAIDTTKMEVRCEKCGLYLEYTIEISQKIVDATTIKIVPCPICKAEGRKS